MPNEKFSGKGHRNHICKKCSQLPKKERERIERIDELRGFLSQSNISKKNIARLKHLVSLEDEDVAKFANIVLEVALAHPRKKKRLSFLKRERKDIIKKLKDSELLFWMEIDF
ncbi:MAG TPA: hypothetical protein ENN22_03865 [bacterium]|nr:hypothetical protein [bacterium]